VGIGLLFCGALIEGDAIGGGAGGGEGIIRGGDAGGQDAGVEVDVAAGAVGFGLDARGGEGAEVEGAPGGGPGFGGVGSGVAGIGDGDDELPVLGRCGDALDDVLFEEVGVAFG
jgi:hypothetical protein